MASIPASGLAVGDMGLWPAIRPCASTVLLASSTGTTIKLAPCAEAIRNDQTVKSWETTEG